MSPSQPALSETNVPVFPSGASKKKQKNKRDAVVVEYKTRNYVTCHSFPSSAPICVIFRLTPCSARKHQKRKKYQKEKWHLLVVVHRAERRAVKASKCEQERREKKKERQRGRERKREREREKWKRRFLTQPSGGGALLKERAHQLRSYATASICIFI